MMSYVYGIGRVSEVDGSDNTYYLPDALGSTMALCDASGTMAAAEGAVLGVSEGRRTPSRRESHCYTRAMLPNTPEMARFRLVAESCRSTDLGTKRARRGIRLIARRSG
jgi:hypothetical protein